jgi:hypothetical protein
MLPSCLQRHLVLDQNWKEGRVPDYWYHRTFEESDERSRHHADPISFGWCQGAWS